MARGLKLYRGSPCPYGHDGTRRTTNKVCVICHREAVKKYQQNPEVREALKERRRGLYLDQKKAYYAKRMADPEIAAAERARWKTRHKKYPESYAQRGAARRARKASATPPWLTQDHKQQIKEVYRAARRQSLATGLKHNVDHIHPLRGSNFCGLHVPWNLCILTDSENKSKGNRLPPDVPTW